MLLFPLIAWTVGPTWCVEWLEKRAVHFFRVLICQQVFGIHSSVCHHAAPPWLSKGGTLESSASRGQLITLTNMSRSSSSSSSSSLSYKSSFDRVCSLYIKWLDSTADRSGCGTYLKVHDLIQNRLPKIAFATPASIRAFRAAHDRRPLQKHCSMGSVKRQPFLRNCSPCLSHVFCKLKSLVRKRMNKRPRSKNVW